MRSPLPAVAAALLLSACGAGAGAARPAAAFPLGADTVAHEDSLTVTGYGLPSGPAGTRTQLKARTRDAALLEARAKLKAYLESIAPPGAEAAVAKLARRARVVYVNWEDDGGATAMLELDKDRINDALGTSFR